MGRELLLREGLGQKALNLFAQQLALADLCLNEFGGALESPCRLQMEGEEQGIFEAVPEGVARAHRVGKGVQCKQVKILRSLDLGGKGLDDFWVIKVPPLRGLHHGEVVLDNERKCVGGGAVESEPLADLQGQFSPDQFVASSWEGLAAIVQQQR